MVEGRKIWHTGTGSYDLREGTCVFVRKGACIIEQFFDAEFCFFMFFVSDEFICEVLKNKSNPVIRPIKKYEPVMTINNSVRIHAFFQSMTPYFDSDRKPDQSLVELKFRELILNIADNPLNAELLSWFFFLLRDPQSLTLQRVMEENFCFNLKLEEFAKLSARSLSAFKRDFMNIYNTSPGKWLMEKRLTNALHLITNMDKTVTEAAFESGFENTSHFSRAFRQRFGTSPVSMKHAAAI